MIDTPWQAGTHRRAWRALFAAATFGSVLAGSVATALPLPRSALWAVVRSCVLAERTIGRPFPCLRVSLGSDGMPGFAVLRAPGSDTHVIVTPTVALAGIESEELQRDGAGQYWRAALDARRDVIEGAGGRVLPGAVGLALNSSETRSQDQLHIHAECFRPDVLKRLRAEKLPDDATWRTLRGTLDGEHYGLRALRREEITAGNLFALLRHVPDAGGNLSRSKVLVIERDGNGGLILAVSRSGRHSIERVLDPDCRVTVWGT